VPNRDRISKRPETAILAAFFHYIRTARFGDDYHVVAAAMGIDPDYYLEFEKGHIALTYGLWCEFAAATFTCEATNTLALMMSDFEFAIDGSDVLAGRRFIQGLRMMRKVAGNDIGRFDYGAFRSVVVQELRRQRTELSKAALKWPRAVRVKQ
jgi:hypothetical protein